MLLTPTKTDAVAHPGDVSHKTFTSEVPMPLRVEELAICQEVSKGMMLGNNSKAVPLLFQAPGTQPFVGQQELFQTAALHGAAFQYPCTRRHSK